jgi:hypothetical protein
MTKPVTVKGYTRNAEKTPDPFADVADLVDSETEGVADSDEFQMHFHDYLMASWKLSIFRRARALLGGENAGN